MEPQKHSRSGLVSLFLLAGTAAACATPAPTSPQDAYNQAVQSCEQARAASAGQPPAAVEAAFNACMAQAVTVGPK
jgi:hypothetical protein